MDDPRITGLLVNYYFTCERKVWLFYKGLRFEKGHERVELGKLYSDATFTRKEHELIIDETISIDFMEKGKIHEIKLTNKNRIAALWQVKYYLYYLAKKKGLSNISATIHYIENRTKERLQLTEADFEEIERVMEEIKKLLRAPKPPPPERKRFCRKCAYYEFCFV